MSSITDVIIADLRKMQAQRDLAEKMNTLSSVKQLQEWQCKRLLSTHKELAEQAEYRNAMDFFIDELYGPKDFSQRDADIARVVPKLASLLPQKAMQALADAIYLSSLSFDLDLDLIHKLEGDLNATSYALAYRKMGRLDDRIVQIDTIENLGKRLADVVAIRGVKMLLNISRKPAKIAGVLSLHKFLERGFNAFKDMGEVNDFVSPIITKEKEIMYTLQNHDINLHIENPIPNIES